MPELQASPMNVSKTAPGHFEGGEECLRARVYSLLGRLLAGAPDSHMLALLAEVEVGDPSEDASLGASWRRLLEAAAGAAEQDLRDEYQNLFIGLGRGEVVPHGSWYITGYLMERPLAELREDLVKLGLERSQNVNEPEDHAALLCEVMAVLCTDGSDSEVRADFFHRHMEPWMGKFFRDLQEAQSARFYKTVGDFGQRFMEIETRFFGIPQPKTV